MRSLTLSAALTLKPAAIRFHSSRQSCEGLMLPTIKAAGLDSQAIEKAVRLCLPERVRTSLSWSSSGYRILGELTQAELDAAAEVIEASKTRPDHDFVVKEVTRMLLATRSKAADAEEWKMRIGIYVEELSVLPADCIRSGCRAWARENTFSPSVHELLSRCNEFAKERYQISNALFMAGYNLKRYGSTRARH